MRRSLRWLLVAVLLAVMLTAAGVVWRLARPSRAESRVRQAIEAELASTPAEPGDRVVDAVREFYRHRGHQAAWSDGRRPNGDAFDLARVLEQADHEGLEPATYQATGLTVTLEELRGARFAAVAPDAVRLAGLDLRLTRAFLGYARDVHEGRLPPAALDPDWVAAREPLDLLRTLRHALAAHRVEQTLAELAPRSEGYRLLRAALVRCEAVAAAGGWPALPAGPELKRGDRGAGVLALRRRLALEAGSDSAGHSPEFDAELQQALRTFQARHGLRPSGALDADTRAALAVPAARRARQMALNLERWRWLPPAFPEPNLQVSLADFTFDLRDSGRVVLRSRVVVGERRNPTPVFSDAVTYLTLNPSWRLPKRILVEEIIPALKRDTTWMRRHEMRVYFTRAPQLTEVPVSRVDWKSVEEDTFPYIVAQDPGDENPLGRVKFMCPNEYDVYLHDTPLKGYFSAAARAYSHGCVRVQKARELLAWLVARDTLAQMRALRGRPRRPDLRDSLTAVFDSLVTRRIALREPLPVHFLYWTAWVDSAGGVQFREDLYGIDARLDEALRSGRTAQFVLNPELEWGVKHRRTPADSALAAGGAGRPRAEVSPAAAGSSPPTPPAPDRRRPAPAGPPGASAPSSARGGAPGGR